MRDTEAQISIDFLIGIVVFAGIILFAFQFVSSTAIPFVSSQTSDQKVTKVQTVGDRLYHGKLATDRVGSLDLSYFSDENGTGVKNESVLSDELGIPDNRNLSVEVTKPDGSPVVLNGENIDIGDKPRGAAAARATRVGNTESNDTVVIDLEVW